MKLSMFALLLLALSLTLAAAVQPITDGTFSEDEEFERYTNVYNKNYESESVRAKRKSTFFKNKELVVSHNAEAAKGVHSFTLELNEFADLTNQEYREMFLGTKASTGRVSAHMDSYSPKGSDAPAAWDWRTNASNVVGPVKNQGSCGSCWAFSAVAAMEGQLNHNTGKIHSLSEQELVDCVRGGKDTCSEGGEMYDGEEYGTTNGMEAEADYPYQGSSGNKCGYDAKKVVHKFSGYTNITSGDEKALKQAAYEQPIISVGIDASSIWFQLYFGGVYNVKSCSSTNLDHGVAVVGYGTTPVKGVSTDFWMVRNSWGKMWGMSGYIMMSRNKNNQCGIATQASFAKL
jgi:cathepsin L|eukprot:g245.t1